MKTAKLGHRGLGAGSRDLILNFETMAEARDLKICVHIEGWDP